METGRDRDPRAKAEGDAPRDGGGLDRRTLLRGLLALPLAGLAPGGRQESRPQGGAGPDRAPTVAVVGAGAFGGWTALWLRRRGARVTLLDAWGPGNPRSSSGGESRVIRGIYGPDQVYVDWVVRSFAHWREAEARWGQRLYHPTGGLWLFRGDDAYARSSLPLLAAAGLAAEELTLAAARQRFPQLDLAGVRSAFYEAEAGYLEAREACQAVARAFLAEGGEYRQRQVEPGAIANRALTDLRLSDGTHLAADAYVFACGPWLGRLFPEVVGGRVRPTRQEVFFFGLPPGDERFDEGHLPVWVDFGERLFYGVPGNDGRGFKVADDTAGEEVDPTTLDRTPSPEGLARARAFLAERFPALAGAPLLEARVCQYESSPDGHFLIDRHPEAGNVWLVGGGSGHGFKMGPAVGEHAADLVLGRRDPLPRFGLARFAEQGPGGGRRQTSARDEG